MRYVLFAGLLVAALAGCRSQEPAEPAAQAPGASAATNEPGETAAQLTVGGVVTGSSGNEITVQTAQGEQITMQLDPEAQVMRGDSRAEPGDIVEGAAVRASYREQDGRKVAKRVDIDSLPGQAPSRSVTPGSQGMQEAPSGAVPAR